MNWEAAPAAPAPSAASTRCADSSVRQAAASPTLTRMLNDELTRPRLIAPARRGRPLVSWSEANVVIAGTSPARSSADSVRSEANVVIAGPSPAAIQI
jgi:hypothetical protein